MTAMVAAGLIGVAGSPAAAAISYKGVFTFNKGTITDSRLTFDVYRLDRDPPLRVLTKTWRAGSGGNTVVCDKSTGPGDPGGWLPNGIYNVKLHENYQGTLIKGIAFQLEDMPCASGGVRRTELFIHTETPWSSPNSYRSSGCIKLSPTDIKAARDAFRTYFAANTWYTDMLQVIS